MNIIEQIKALPESNTAALVVAEPDLGQERGIYLRVKIPETRIAVTKAKALAESHERLLEAMRKVRTVTVNVIDPRAGLVVIGDVVYEAIEQAEKLYAD